MSATFTSRDLDGLSQMVSAASRPFTAPTVDDWRADVLRTCCQLLDGQMGHFDLLGLGLDNPYFVDRYPAGVFDEWLVGWGADSDAALDVTARLNLTVFTRSHRYRLAGDHWTERYKRSHLYTEFYAKYGLLHAGGLYYRSGETTAFLLVESDALADEAFDERARRMLRVVEPVFQSSIRSLSRADGGHWSAATLLNAINEPIALVRADGRWVHRSTTFDAALATIPAGSRSLLLDAIVHHAAALLTAARSPGGWSKSGGRPPAERPARPMWNCDGLTVLLTTIDAAGDPEPACLVRLVVRSEANLAQAVAAGLTRREAVVAIYLVDGLTNKEIARRLSISSHTARRHTESILKKLGVSNRTSVARALRGTSLPAAG